MSLQSLKVVKYNVQHAMHKPSATCIGYISIIMHTERSNARALLVLCYVSTIRTKKYVLSDKQRDILKVVGGYQSVMKLNCNCYCWDRYFCVCKDLITNI